MDVAIFIIFGWVVLALITMYMADKRGRSKVLGFVGGLIFGVFSILYYLIAGETEELKMARMSKYFGQAK